MVLPAQKANVVLPSEGSFSHYFCVLYTLVRWVNSSQQPQTSGRRAMLLRLRPGRPWEWPRHFELPQLLAASCTGESGWRRRTHPV